MKRSSAACAMAAVLLAAGGVHANEKLAQASGCMTCHAMDKKLLGPSYKEVAAKYRNDKSAEGALIQKVKKGGKGVWGEMPMPANAHVSDANIKTIVEWILSVK